MPGFEIESELPVDARTLARELFNLTGVNRELSPWIRMSAPADWREKPLSEWPCGVWLFRSVIALFGWIPVDLHHFRLREVSDLGFSECSRSILNREWHHERTVIPGPSGSRIRDSVEFRSHLGPLGQLLLPLYKAIFRSRHRKLKLKYRLTDR